MPVTIKIYQATFHIKCIFVLIVHNFLILEMDLETENRIAAILMKEAAELRRQAARDGVDAYLRPNIRGRPNSRFLTATVLGVQQCKFFCCYD